MVATPKPPRPAKKHRSDSIWKALAHPVRRALLDELRKGPRLTGELAALFPRLSRFAAMQHLKVLVGARLVIRRKSGRMRIHFLNAVPIREIYERWVSRYEGAWSSALIDLKQRAESGTEASATSTSSEARGLFPISNQPPSRPSTRGRRSSSPSSERLT